MAAIFCSTVFIHTYKRQLRQTQNLLHWAAFVLCNTELGKLLAQIRIFIRTLGAAIIHNTVTMLKKKNTLKQ